MKKTRTTIGRTIKKINDGTPGVSQAQRLESCKAHCYRIAVFKLENGRKLTMQEAKAEHMSLDYNVHSKVTAMMNVEFAKALGKLVTKHDDGATVTPIQATMNAFNQEVSEEHKFGVIDSETRSRTETVVDVNIERMREEVTTTHRPNGEVVETKVHTVEHEVNQKRSQTASQKRSREKYEAVKRTVRKLFEEDSIETLLKLCDEYKMFVNPYRNLRNKLRSGRRSKPELVARLRKRYDDDYALWLKHARLIMQLMMCHNPEDGYSEIPFERPKNAFENNVVGAVDDDTMFIVTKFLPLRLCQLASSQNKKNAWKMVDSFGIYGGDPRAVRVRHVDAPLVPLMMLLIAEAFDTDDDDGNELLSPVVRAMRALRPVRVVLGPLYRQIMEACGAPVPEEASQEDDQVQARIIRRVPKVGTEIGFEPSPVKGLAQVTVDTFEVEYDLRRVPGLQELHASAKQHAAVHFLSNPDVTTLLPSVVTDDEITRRDMFGIPALTGRVFIGMSIGFAAAFERTNIRSAERNAKSRVTMDILYLRQPNMQQRVLNGYVPTADYSRYVDFFLERVALFTPEWIEECVEGMKVWGNEWLPGKKSKKKKKIESSLVASNSSEPCKMMMLPSIEGEKLSMAMVKGDNWQQLVTRMDLKTKAMVAGATVGETKLSLHSWLNAAAEVAAAADDTKNRHGLPLNIFGDDPTKFGEIMDALAGLKIGVN